EGSRDAWRELTRGRGWKRLPLGDLPNRTDSADTRLPRAGAEADQVTLAVDHGARARVALEPDSRPDRELAPGTSCSPPLGTGMRLTQTFRVDGAALQRLDLFPLTFVQPLAHHVRPRMVAADAWCCAVGRAAHAP